MEQSVDEAPKRNAVEVPKEITRLLIKVKKERKSPVVSSDAHNSFDVHENSKIELKGNNQNNVDQANNITKYVIARNQSTEIVDVDN